MEDDASNSTANHRRSLFPPENCPQVSDEAFNLFHAIDRELYTRLIQNLGRDPAASVQVMAFWIWLERETNDMNLIKRMLSLPPPLLNDVADETETCLKCIETDAFHFGEITLLPSLLSGGGGGGNPIVVNLRFLHENRIAVLRGVSKIINTVCSRAFSDILRRNWRAAAYHQAAAEGGPAAANGAPAVHFLGGGVREVGESSREAAERRVIEGGGLAASPPIMRRMLFAPHMNVPFVPLPPPHVLTAGAHGGAPPPGLVADAIGIPVQMLAAAAGGSFPAYDLGAQRQMLSNELGELLSRNLSINTPMNHQETTNAVNNGGGVVVGDDGEEEEVGPDDRTIFLTFSKGYPITEDEVREFFTRKFGDFIEDMIMQEVGEDEQVLYARMVARSTAVIDPIVRGNKAKYSINGKHVWARKYIKKSTSSPPRGDHNNPSSSSGQEAAVATGSPSS